MPLRRGAPRGTAEHPDALDADVADAVVAVDLSGRELGVQREQLAVRRVADDRFVVCCAPFFAYDVACGDEIRAVVPPDGAGDETPEFDAVVAPGGRTALRVLFTTTASVDGRADLTDAVGRCGGRIERYTDDYLAIDVADADGADVVRLLEAYERDDLLHWETAHTS
jgi:hypothetical protein